MAVKTGVIIFLFAVGLTPSQKPSASSDRVIQTKINHEGISNGIMRNLAGLPEIQYDLPIC